MSNTSPPIEEQHRFARSQTPESPRPVHVPEPANIPILRNQMDPVFNDTTTYNIPSDQNFAHYGESLENPNYKTTPMEENMEFKKFFLEAENQVAHPQLLPISSEPNATTNAPENLVAASSHTNQFGQTSLSGQVGLDSQSTAAQGDLHPSQTTNSNFWQSENNKAQENAESNHIPSENQVAQSIETSTTSNAASAEVKPDNGVDYQSLLDTISQSASTAPAPDTVTALTTEPSVPDAHTSSLPSFPGLPPKPPPLQTQSAFSTSLEHVQYPQQPNSATAAGQSSQLPSSNGYDFTTNGTNSSTIQSDRGDTVMSGLSDVGITNEQAIAMHMQNQNAQSDSRARSPSDRTTIEPSDRPWSPKTQAVYDAFLEDERRYVTEGIWDRFPLGSRLFVGNLPSEKVTKRDLFHRFHRFGKLAQISIKQAYGFVQYHDAASCKAALDAEQGVELRGRKVHLEISKPQKNTKGPGSGASKPQPQTQTQSRRRSRSPQRRSYSDFRDEPARRREEYRSRRSPSPPRGYRRDDRDFSRNGRRSPIYGNSYGAPQSAAYDDEASLPYPRRDPRNVPDVQLIVIDTVDQAFINWIEDGFRRKGLQAATTWLSPRTPLPAVVKRQIVEGVQAIVKISSSHQVRSKIPLQVFDRGGGSSNVTFNEYADLDVPVAADLVLQARRRERGGMQPPPPQYPPSMYPQSPYQQSPNTSTGAPSPWGPPPPPQYPPQHLHPYQPPAPQQTYRPPPQSPFSNTPQIATGQPNLQDLLANLKGGNAPPTPQSAHSSQPQTPYGQPPQQYGYGPPQPPQMHHQAYSQYQQPQSQSQPPAPPTGQHNVQHIMDQLARQYQR